MAETTIPTDDQVFNYTIQPKPTVYEGRLFRSNLEATWAAFFDNMGWKWEYEPIVLDGWIPDFLLKQWGTDVWCEVKPMHHDVHLPTCEKMRAAMPAGHLLFLGTSPDTTRTEFADHGFRRSTQERIRLGWYHDEYSEWSPVYIQGMSSLPHTGVTGAWDTAIKTTYTKGRCW